MPQLLQLDELQLEHEPAVPATGVETPPLLLENEANRENTRLATCWHFGHETSWSALVTDLISSNLHSHWVHRYS